MSALCGGDPARLLSLSARFSDQVYMGDAIITRLWELEPGRALLQVETGRGNVVLNQGLVTYNPN